MIQLSIVKTSKGYSPRDAWSIFDREKLTFPNLRAAKEHLKEHIQYRSAKRVPMYGDNPDGTAKKVGYVIGFRASWGGKNWLEQHWIEFQEVHPITP